MCDIVRELLVLRHAKSSWDTGVPTDFERPLSGRGKRDAPRVGAWLAARGLVPDIVVSSPARRARQTARRVARALDLDPGGITFDERVYDAATDNLVRVLADVPADAQRVLLVGHNPGMENLVRWMASDPPETPPNDKLLPTGALARLRVASAWGDLSPRIEHLVEIVRPKEIP